MTEKKIKVHPSISAETYNALKERGVTPRKALEEYVQIVENNSISTIPILQTELAVQKRKLQYYKKIVLDLEKEIQELEDKIKELNNSSNLIGAVKELEELLEGNIYQREIRKRWGIPKVTRETAVKTANKYNVTLNDLIKNTDNTLLKKAYGDGINEYDRIS